MGILMGKQMQEQMEKNQEIMLKNGRIQMERQMQMQRLLMQQQMAVSLARSRDLFNYWAAFYVVASLGCVKAYSVKRNPIVVAPLVPLTFLVTYFGDLAYGYKMTRIRAEALRILENESDLLDLPKNFPSINLLDSQRESYSYDEGK